MNEEPTPDELAIGEKIRLAKHARVQMAQLLETQIDLVGQHTKLIRATYEGYIESGFTEAQAFELVKARGTL